MRTFLSIDFSNYKWGKILYLRLKNKLLTYLLWGKSISSNVTGVVFGTSLCFHDFNKFIVILKLLRHQSTFTRIYYIKDIPRLFKFSFKDTVRMSQYISYYFRPFLWSVLSLYVFYTQNHDNISIRDWMILFRPNKVPLVQVSIFEGRHIKNHT